MKKTGKGRYMVDLLFMGEGGTPALLLSWSVKFGGNMIEKKFLSGAVGAAYSLPLLFFKFSRAQIVRTHQNKKVVMRSHIGD